MTIRRRDIDKLIARKAAESVAVGGFVHGVFPTLLVFGTWALGGPLILTRLDDLSRHGMDLTLVTVLLVTTFLALLSIPLIILTIAAQSFRVSATGLRKLADLLEHVTPLEAEYCYALAEMIEQDALTNTAGREVIAALNTLLHNSRLLEARSKEMQPAVSGQDVPSLEAEEARLRGLLEAETDAAHRTMLEQLLQLNTLRRGNLATIEQATQRLCLRQEVIQQTFIGLRETLLRMRLAHQNILGDALVFDNSGKTEATAHNLHDVVTQLQQQVRSLEQANVELLAIHSG